MSTEGRDLVRLVLLCLTLFVTNATRGRAQIPDLPFGTASVLCSGPVEDTAHLFGLAQCTTFDPEVIATASTSFSSAEARGSVTRQSSTDPGGLAQASATLVYYIVLLRNLLPLPSPLPLLPLGIEYSLTASADNGGAQASIVAGPQFGGALLLDDSVSTNLGVAKRSETEHVLVAGQGAQLRVSLTASATGRIRFPEDSEELHSSGYAKADPIVFLDQEMMDAMYGEESFPLVDYYTIEVSPGISNTLLFGDGFESGTTIDWSAVAP